MNTTALEALCAERDNTLMELTDIETKLVYSTNPSEVRDLLERRDATFAKFVELQTSFDTFYDRAPKPSLLKRIFKK